MVNTAADVQVSDESLTCADGGQRNCHSNANCVDYDEGYCCECVAPYIGNGEECIRPGKIHLLTHLLACLFALAYLPAHLLIYNLTEVAHLFAHSSDLLFACSLTY